MTATIYVSFGNSDDNMPQRRWSMYCHTLITEIDRYAQKINCVWYSLPSSIWQNTCVSFEIDRYQIDNLRDGLEEVVAHHGKEPITWAEARTNESLGEPI